MKRKPTGRRRPQLSITELGAVFLLDVHMNVLLLVYQTHRMPK
jgi:hypothetical protein